MGLGPAKVTQSVRPDRSAQRERSHDDDSLQRNSSRCPAASWLEADHCCSHSRLPVRVFDSAAFHRHRNDGACSTAASKFSSRPSARHQIRVSSLDARCSPALGTAAGRDLCIVIRLVPANGSRPCRPASRSSVDPDLDHLFRRRMAGNAAVPCLLCVTGHGDDLSLSPRPTSAPRDTLERFSARHTTFPDGQVSVRAGSNSSMALPSGSSN